MDNKSGHYFIWGMGLLGASLGKALLKNGAEVSGCVRSEKSRAVLKDMGFQNVFLSHEESLWEAILHSDGIIFGTPVDAIYPVLDLFARNQLPQDIWVTDMASTKADLMRYVESHNYDFNFIGSHPMAGSDKTGPEHADASLFEGATVYITESPAIAERVNPVHYEGTLRNVRELWKSVGASPWEVSYKVHDKWAAYLSHGLHLVSCMVSHLLKEIPEVLELPVNPAGGSFRDITRVAGSNPALWNGIISSNYAEVESYLESLEKLVGEWRGAMQKKALPIQDIFREAADLREKVIQKDSRYQTQDKKNESKNG